MSKIEVFDRETNRHILVTPWFDGSVKPARPGVYQRKYPTGPAYCQWNGSSWCTGSARVEWAMSGTISPLQGLRWRGLAEQPK